MAETGTRTDPYRDFNFKLEISGVTEASFARAEGLGARIEKILYREAGAGQQVRSLPGRVEYFGVTLRYGVTSSTQLAEWFDKTSKGIIERKACSIVLLDEDGTTPVARWNLDAAWPEEWRGAVLDAQGNSVAIESLTLTHEGVQRL